MTQRFLITYRLGIRLLAALIGVLGLMPMLQAKPQPSLEQARERVGKLVLPWVENAGQWDSRAAFRAQSFAGAVWVTREGQLVHQFNGPQRGECAEPQARRRPTERCERAPGWVLTERFVGGQVQAIRGEQPEEGRVSYMVGEASRHAQDLPSYRRLDLGEVYPGVKVELKASQANVEKLYTVAPGRDPNVIRMRLEGAKAVRLTPEGAVEADTDHGPIRFTPPVAFQHDARQERQEVAVRYVLSARKGGSVEYGFALGAYDKRRPLTIDPLLQSTYLGGSGTDQARALAIHPASGEVYVVGYTDSIDLPGTTGGAQAAKAAGTDAFVSRFNAALTSRLQSSYLGGAGADFANALAIHPVSGEVYVAGWTESTDLPGTAGGAQVVKGTDTDAFLSRLDAVLTTRLQSTYLGGNGNDYATALAIHPVSGEIYLAGYTTSTDLPGTAGGAQASKGAGLDAFVSRFNAALTGRLQSTYHGGNGSDEARALAIHPLSGEVYVAGETGSSDLPGTTGGAQAGKAANDDAFVSRFNAALTTSLQSTYLGGSGGDFAYSLAIHAVSGEVYVAGSTSSTDLPGTAGGAQAAKATGDDAFLSRFNAALTTRLQSTYHGGGGNDYAYALAIHPVSGEVYVAGFTASTDLPGTTGGAQAAKAASFDAFLSRINAALTTRLQSSYLGGSGSDGVNGLAIHPVSGEVYVAGQTASSDLPGTTGGAQAVKATGNDAFVSRLSLDLLAADVAPNPFTLPAQFGVPLASLRTAGPVQITGIAALAPITISGALGSQYCVSSTNACTCDASPGSDWGTTGMIANSQYLCVRHVSASSAITLAETVIVVGGYVTKFITFTGTLAACSLDMDGDGQVTAPKEMLILARAKLGFTPAQAVVGTGITQAQWEAKRAQLLACGQEF